MAKYYGAIGFIENVETDPGVYLEKAIEKKYKGDILRNYRRWDTNDNSTNSNLNINNSISIIADAYALDHAPYIRYVEWMGSYWGVSSIDLSQRPRVILELGGVYERIIEPEEPDESEGPEDSTTEDSGDDSGIE